jgi:uncharacterized protein YjbI with pentapeptide repeats
MNIRWAEITRIWKDNRWLYLITGMLLGILITPLLELVKNYPTNLFYNLVPEALGIFFTVFILDRISEARTEARSTEELKKRLLRESRSQSNETAKAAIDYLREERWLTTKDSAPLLTGANLYNAKLQESDLTQANLEAAQLGLANLQKCYLGGASLKIADLHLANLSESDMVTANLKQAFLRSANLEKANLHRANLQQADFYNANLKSSYLGHANLEQADFEKANLQQAFLQDAYLYNARNLNSARFDTTVILPDKQYWTPNIDMTRYTDPNHPDFWQPEWVKKQNESPQ